jgi:hypothetical protein
MSQNLAGFFGFLDPLPRNRLVHFEPFFWYLGSQRGQISLWSTHCCDSVITACQSGCFLMYIARTLTVFCQVLLVALLSTNDFIDPVPSIGKVVTLFTPTGPFNIQCNDIITLLWTASSSHLETSRSVPTRTCLAVEVVKS